MSRKYIGGDYTLNVYAENSKDHKSLIASASTEQQTRTIQQQFYVTDGADFTNVTGSVVEDSGEYSYANMIFASRSDSGTGLSNRLFTHPKIGDTSNADGTFGRSIVISGSTMVVNSRQRNDVGSSATRSMKDRQGVFVFKSSSGADWDYSDAIFPDFELYPSHNTHGPQPEHVAKNFDMHNKSIAIAAPLSGDLGVALVYGSSSTSGWSHEARLGSASFSGSGGTPAYWVQSDATSNNALSYFIANGQEGIMPSVRLYNNKLVVGGFSTTIRPNTSTSFSTNHRSSSLAVFASSSSGWKFESILPSSHTHTASVNVGDYHRRGMGANPGHFNGALDFDGTRIIGAGQGGYSSATHQQVNGRVSIFNSASAGWYEEDQIDLFSARVTSSVSATLLKSDIETGSGIFAGNQEWKLYNSFGYYSCALSGNYVAATARAYNATAGPSNSPRIKNRIFIFKSSSSGWNREADFKSPNPGTGGDGTHCSASYFDEFGYTLIFNRNVPGILVTRSPSYRGDFANSNSIIGRLHVYKSSSSGWSLAQNIENPYTGSAVSQVGESDYRDDYNDYGDQPTDSGTEGAGEYLDANATGFDGSHLAVPFSNITESENDTGTFAAQQRFGAIQILSGTLSLASETKDVEITESVQVANYILAPTHVMPFIRAPKGAVTIRGQAGSGSAFSSDVGKTQNPG